MCDSVQFIIIGTNLIQNFNKHNDKESRNQAKYFLKHFQHMIRCVHATDNAMFSVFIASHHTPATLAMQLRRRNKSVIKCSSTSCLFVIFNSLLGQEKNIKINQSNAEKTGSSTFPMMVFGPNVAKTSQRRVGQSLLFNFSPRS